VKHCHCALAIGQFISFHNWPFPQHLLLNLVLKLSVVFTTCTIPMLLLFFNILSANFSIKLVLLADFCMPAAQTKIKLSANT